MKTIKFLRIYILTLLVFLVNTNVYAVWSEFVYVSPKTQAKSDLKVIAQNDNGILTLKVLSEEAGFNNRVATLVETQNKLSLKEQESLRWLLWEQEELNDNIVFTTKLSANTKSQIQKKIERIANVEVDAEDSNYYEFVVNTNDRNYYIYIDYPNITDDGGYWYSVDVSEYFNNVDTNH